MYLIFQPDVKFFEIAGDAAVFLWLFRRLAGHVVSHRAAHFRSAVAARRRRLSVHPGPETRDNRVDVTTTCSDDVNRWSVRCPAAKWWQQWDTPARASETAGRRARVQDSLTKLAKLQVVGGRRHKSLVFSAEPISRRLNPSWTAHKPLASSNHRITMWWLTCWISHSRQVRSWQVSSCTDC